MLFTLITAAAVLVTVVAGRRTVDVPTYTLVRLVRLDLGVRRLRVAVDAAKSRIVGRDQMAVVTNRAMVGNREVGVIEGCAEPGSCVVASRAAGRVTGGDVIRHATAKRGGALPRRGVATIAVRVCRSQAEVVIDVAGAARSAHVRAGKGPAGGAVIEFSVRPFGDRMTARARRGGRRKA